MGSDHEDALSVERVERSEAHHVVSCLVEAFWDFPETCHLLPRASVRRRVLPRFLGADTSDAAAFGGLEAVRSNGVVVGAAAWLPPTTYPVSVRRQLQEATRLAPIAPWALGALREALRGRAANRHHHTSCPPHYWLRAIGVRPEHHGKGIGTLLVSSLLRRAEHDERGCFLFTATAQNASWYESFGFTVTASYHPTATWPEVWAMWRDARPCPSSPRPAI